MTRTLPQALALALLLAPGSIVSALAQQGAKPGARTGAEKSGAAPVIGCPSLANYRMLMHDGPAAAAALLADSKADHLGCSSVPRGRITGIADRAALGSRGYTCVAIQGTTACHWVADGVLPAANAGAAGGGGR